MSDRVDRPPPDPSRAPTGEVPVVAVDRDEDAAYDRFLATGDDDMLTRITAPEATVPDEDPTTDLSEVTPPPPRSADLDRDDDPEPEAGDPAEDRRDGSGLVLARRRFLQFMVAGGAAAAGVGVVYTGRDRTPPPTIAQPSTQVGVLSRANTATVNEGQMLSSAVPNRVLVLVEMEGGNDGLSTVIPYGNGGYYDVRPNIAIAAEEILTLDSEVGLHPNLARLHQRGLAIVEGVGPVDGNLSHFEMVQRWDRGDVNGDGEEQSGFLARLADTLDDASPLVGLSVGGATPRFANSQASTVALDDPRSLRYLTATDDNRLLAYQESLPAFGRDETEMMGMVGSSWGQLLQLGAAVNAQLEREPDESNSMFTDGGGLGRQLALASTLIAADIGVRVVHARIGGFDTHENHRNRHDQLMARLDAAIDGFLTQIEADGAADRVLVATTSEFGRRVAENEGGTDHGSASVMFVAGPVTAGRYGVHTAPNLVDGRGNLPTEVPFDSYLATLAQSWLGIEAASVLAGEPEPVPLLF